MKLVAITLLMLILSSCAVKSKKIAGVYSSNPYFEVSAKLQLNADGTFLYENGLHYPHTMAQGSWLIEKKHLLLKSYPIDKNLRVIFRNAKQSNFTINVTDDENTPLPGVFINIYKEGKSDKIYTDKVGRANFNYQKIDSIVVGLLGFNTIRFVPQANTNSFDVKLGYYDYAIVKDEPWKINNGKLYNPEYEKYGKRYVFRKQKDKKFPSN